MSAVCFAGRERRLPRQTSLPAPGGVSLIDALGFTFGPLELAALPPPNGVLLRDIFTPPGVILTPTNPPSGAGPARPSPSRAPTRARSSG